MKKFLESINIEKAINAVCIYGLGLYIFDGVLAVFELKTLLIHTIATIIHCGMFVLFLFLLIAMIYKLHIVNKKIKELREFVEEKNVVYLGMYKTDIIEKLDDIIRTGGVCEQTNR